MRRPSWAVLAGGGAVVALVAAIGLPLYYYRGRILARVLRHTRRARLRTRRLTDRDPAT